MLKGRVVESKFAINNLDPFLCIAAFTENTHLSAWWGVSKSLIELRAGGIYSLAWLHDESGFSFISSGLVRSYRAGHHLILDRLIYMNPAIKILGPMSLDIRISHDGNTDWLRVIQSGYQEGTDWDWYYEAVRIGWPKALGLLEDYLTKLEN